MPATSARGQGGEEIVRAEAPHVLAALVRRYGQFELAEEATQDALFEALRSWGTDLPDNPRGWLIRIAQRRLIDSLRAEYARAEREHRYAVAGEPGDQSPSPHDDSLELLFLCCHSVLSPALAIPLTLRAVCGLTTSEIASAFFVPSPTMGQRISRAKSKLRGIPLVPADSTSLRSERLDSVLSVLSIMFNEGYTSSAGESLDRADIASEALRLTTMLHRAFPEHAETEGLLALMLLHTARRPARISDNLPVPIEQQNRALWISDLIQSGIYHVEHALATGPLGRFQLMAAITAIHCETADASSTDWCQILALHDLLLVTDPSPMARLSRIVALSRVHGPRYALLELDELCRSPLAALSHRSEAIRGHLLADIGDQPGAEAAFRAAAASTRSIPERQHLLARAEQVRRARE
ncbi:RNA polymerase sigma factor [uncultured Corynebacterium sp.]|uniref:RNA polymerase sigma factor n=1 Tax=uncultured Corynebacterium sp. TaxID=159447 RepID=UPI002598118C|nr:DUF6596 domain-containing protein [uncultured Corynebacterium sp.]